MSEMVERVMEAIDLAEARLLAGEDRKSVARAAITATRDPTEAMIEILLRNMSENEDSPNTSDDAIALWHDLNDEALK